MRVFVLGVTSGYQNVKTIIKELPVFTVLSAIVLWQRTTFKEHSPFGKLLVNQLANKLQALQATRRFVAVSANRRMVPILRHTNQKHTVFT